MVVPLSPFLEKRRAPALVVVVVVVAVGRSVKSLPILVVKGARQVREAVAVVALALMTRIGILCAAPRQWEMTQIAAWVPLPSVLAARREVEADEEDVEAEVEGGCDGGVSSIEMEEKLGHGHGGV